MAHTRAMMMSVWFALLLASSCVAREARQLHAYDAWVKTTACPQLPSSARDSKDSFGRYWGWNSATSQSCAYKFDNQQAMQPGVITTQETFEAAAACDDVPNADNSAADASSRLWGVWYGKQCAYKDASNVPLYYAGYSGAHYVAHSPAPSSSPSSQPATSPSPASPAPSPKLVSPSPAMQQPSTSPSPTPASPPPSPKPSPVPGTSASGLQLTVSPAPQASPVVWLNVDPTGDGTCSCSQSLSEVAAVVVEQLWQKLLSNSTTPYKTANTSTTNTTSTSTTTSTTPDVAPSGPAAAVSSSPSLKTAAMPTKESTFAVSEASEPANVSTTSTTTTGVDGFAALLSSMLINTPLNRPGDEADAVQLVYPTRPTGSLPASAGNITTNQDT